MRSRERREPVEAIQIKPGEIRVGKGVFFKDEEDEYVELYKKKGMKLYGGSRWCRGACNKSNGYE